jgi:hypothetical protein
MTLLVLNGVVADDPFLFGLWINYEKAGKEMKVNLCGNPKCLIQCHPKESILFIPAALEENFGRTIYEFCQN